MKIRYAVATLALAGTAFGIGTAVTQSADASAPVQQTVSKTTWIVSPRCYAYKSVTTTYYYWSSTKGWTRYAAPRVTTTTGTTCH